MRGASSIPRDPHVARDFAEAVNMTAAELRSWLETETSRRVGWKGPDGSRVESVGHASGRWIAEILDKSLAQLTGDDYAQMRKTVGFVRRHLAQEPENRVTSRWRYSLMNWGHDPLKGREEARGHRDARGGGIQRDHRPAERRA